MTRFIIAGAPCSGKSTYVRQNAKSGDLIYDYDTLHQAMSNQPSHIHMEEIRPYVLAARDAIYDELEANEQQSAWIITSTHKADDLQKLGDRFRAEIIFLDVNRSEAHLRASVDGRPGEWHTYIDNWFNESDINGNLKARSNTMSKKTFHAPIRLKTDGQEGEFTAEFATLDVIDHDRDVTRPGAFHEGQETLIEPWNHNYGQLPVGKGVIHEKDNKAIIEGKFFLDTQAGMDHYKVVKALGPLQEWSYTFEIEHSSQGQFDDQDVQFLESLDVWGVAPVTRGAGVDTHTTDIKSQKKTVPSHTTATSDAAWDGPANESRVRSGENASYYRKIYAWQDPDGDATVKASWKFIHHLVPNGGEPGAADVRACQSAIGVLNGGRGGTTIPDADRQGVWNHLAKHLRDADLEPPELKSLAQPDDQAGNGTSSGVIRTRIELIELEN